MENGEFVDALKCINYLADKIPNNQQLKMYKVEGLAKTGETADAQTLLKTITIAHNGNPDFWYLKGII
jgi:predicted Zn-dependent protease